MQGNLTFHLVYGVFVPTKTGIPFKVGVENNIGHDIKAITNANQNDIYIHRFKVFYHYSTNNEILLAVLLSGQAPIPLSLSLEAGVLNIYDEQKIVLMDLTNKDITRMSENARRKHIRKANNRVLTDKNWKQFINKNNALTGLRWSQNQHGHVVRTYSPLEHYRHEHLNIVHYDT